MPPKVRPLTQLTKEQWQKLLGRLLNKEGGQISPQIANQIFEHEPPITRKMGTLMEKELGPEGEVLSHTPHRLPLEQARAKYFENPEAYGFPWMKEPDAQRLYKVPPGSPEELAQGLAYERQQFQPIISPSERRAANTLQLEQMKGQIDRSMGARGLAEQDLSVSPQKFLTQQEGVKIDQPALGSVIKSAAEADAMWKNEIGGMRTMAGKVWEILRSESRVKSQPFASTTRDYFIWAYNKYNSDPIGFKSKFPREAGLIAKMKEVE